MFCDIKLAFDPAARGFDLVLDRTGAIAVDRTPATPMLVAVFSDRRARADDVLPQDAGALLAPVALNPRRGWVGDALDGEARGLGSLLWLLEREVESEPTRLRAEAYAHQALADLAARRRLTLDVAATWLRRGVLGLAVRLGGARAQLQIAVAGA